ncbi:MAG: SBBP repeat-containing protein, partial [Candidatus Erginobacter occultus]|nr:SBBP repeat-containing protein [Candidatus Erginobacter occultus]
MRNLSTIGVILLLISPLSSGSAEVIELRYSTYLGTAYNEGIFGPAIAVDDSGCIYLTGSTDSHFEFPSVNPYQGTGWGTSPKTFVTKFGPSGSTLEYSTYLGGKTSYGAGQALAVNAQQQTWIGGFTASTDFPVVNAYQAVNAGNEDGFLCRLSSTGSILEFSTYLGGSNSDRVSSIDLDGAEKVYLTGKTFSLNFPTLNAYQSSIGWISGNDSDAFVTKFSSSGTDLLYSTYLGGYSYDGGKALDVSAAGRAYLTGYTYSSNFPTFNAYQVSRSGYNDAYICNLDSNGSSLIFSTYLGGTGEDTGKAITVTDSGVTYLTGETKSDDFPTQGAYQSARAGSQDAFITLFSTAGNLLISTYLGGAAGDSSGGGIALNADGHQVWLTGSTSSPFFPTVDPYQARHGGGTDAFIARFSPGLSILYYSTFLGGASTDEGRGIVSSGESVFITGVTSSINFPTRNAYQASRASSISNDDIFLSKFSPGNSWGYDYNGDGTSDIGIFRESSGLWAIRDLTRVYFGQNGDIPSPGDYDGSGTTEIAVFRPSSGLWALRAVSR